MYKFLIPLAYVLITFIDDYGANICHYFFRWIYVTRRKVCEIAYGSIKGKQKSIVYQDYSGYVYLLNLVPVWL